MKRGITAIVLAATVSTLSGAAVDSAQAATPSDHHWAANSKTMTIAVPMIASLRSGLGIRPDLEIPGNCGTAFLYVGTGSEHINVTYGFKNLTHASIGYSVRMGALNVDDGDTLTDSASGAQAFSHSFERNKAGQIDTGDVQVGASLTSYGVLYNCYSSPALQVTVWVN